MKKIIKIISILLCLALMFPYAAACTSNRTITFDIGEEAGMMDPMTVKKGTVVEKDDIEDPVWEAYSFDGWFVGSDKVVFPYTVNANVTFTAKWSLQNYNITYHLDGGAGATDRTFTLDDLPITLPTASAMNKTNYTFGGWFANSNLTGNPVTRVTGTGHKEYFAKWIPDSYKITFFTNGGEFLAGTNVPTGYAYGVLITLPIPRSDTMGFIGWYADEELLDGPIRTIPIGSTGDKTFWAAWESIDNKIEYKLNGGDFEGYYPQGYQSSTGVTLVKPIRTGYVFGGWYADEGLTDGPVSAIPAGSTGDKTFWAAWTAEEYEVTLHLNGGTGQSTLIYTIEEEVDELPAPDFRQEKWFEGWYDNAAFSGEPVRRNPVREAVIRQLNPAIPKGSMGKKEFWAKWGDRKATEWKFEAEFIDLTGKSGGGWSDSKSEWRMIEGYGPGLTPGASNGYHLTYFTEPYMEFTWEFVSDKAFEGELHFSLFCEFCDNEDFTKFFMDSTDDVHLYINADKDEDGKFSPNDRINYLGFYVDGRRSGFDNTSDVFKDYLLRTAESTALSFKKGKNTVTLQVRENHRFPDRPLAYQSAAPNIDYMMIKTDAFLFFDYAVNDNDELVARGAGSA